VLQITPDDEIVLGAESFTYLDLPRQALFVKEKQIVKLKVLISFAKGSLRLALSEWMSKFCVV